MRSYDGDLSGIYRKLAQAYMGVLLRALVGLDRHSGQDWPPR